MQKIQQGDIVYVLSGRYKKLTGEVLKVFPKENKVLVKGINLAKKHVKPNPQAPAAPSGIIEAERPIHISKVMLVCPTCGKPTRVGIRYLEGEGKPKHRKVRYCKRCGADIPSKVKRGSRV